MLFSFTARIVSALAAFIYPGYASYKTLSQRPASEEDLERWLMYWSVLGCIVGVEYLAEWLVSWIPLYTSLKALFLLYLALPQTQGATYVYRVHLRPFFAAHERQIDSAIAEVRGRAYRFVQEKAQALWAAVVASLAPGGAASAAAAGPSHHPSGPAAGGGASAGPAAGGTGPTALLSTLWTSYGPGIIAGGASLLRQTAAATLPSSASSGPNARSANAFTTPQSSMFFNPALDPAERRRQLEAELAALSSLPTGTGAVPVPAANNPARQSVASFASSSSASSSSGGAGLRERTTSGKFEEIRGGDVEGYEIDDEDDDEGAGGEGKGTASNAKTGWFGGWGAGAGGKDSRGAYERVKSD